MSLISQTCFDIHALSMASFSLLIVFSLELLAQGFDLESASLGNALAQTSKVDDIVR
jgi:hypothetical protein